jgi:prepilin-type processing-associated H-X9-DG protein
LNSSLETAAMDENPYIAPGSGNASGPPQQKKSRHFLKLLVVLGVIGFVIAMLLPAVRTAKGTALRAQCGNNLKQIALALRAYETVYHSLPPECTTDASGKPLHSWRTLILPFIEQQQLYKKIDLTKPWDDPANAEACKTIVMVYHCPSASGPVNDTTGLDNDTTYLAVVTPDSCFRPNEPRRLSEITADPSQTLLVVEVDSDHAVPWMSPRDADEQTVMGIGPNSKLAHAGGFHAAFVDGSVRFLDADMPAAQRRALISIVGNDKAAAPTAK